MVAFRRLFCVCFFICFGICLRCLRVFVVFRSYHLVRGFTKARGRIFSLDFQFDKLGLILPNGNAILQSVSARVKPGAVTAIMVGKSIKFSRQADCWFWSL